MKRPREEENKEDSEDILTAYDPASPITLKDCLLSLETKKKELLDLQNETNEKLAELEMARTKMAADAAKAGSKITFDVGGTIFATTKETLLRQPDTYFTAMLSSGLCEPNQSNGWYFIDRDPTYFGLIMNYLRSGKLNTSRLNDSELRTLQVELDYYQIGQMVAPGCDILSSEHICLLEEWIGKNMDKLLYRGTEHDFSAEEFHKLCDKESCTLVVVKSTEGDVFGGYASNSWDATVPRDSDKGSFVYTLVNPKNVPPTKFMAAVEFDRRRSYDIVRRSDSLPIFGLAGAPGRNTLKIRPPTATKVSFSHLDRYYKDQQNTGLEFLTREENFIVEEMEVFSLKE